MNDNSIGTGTLDPGLFLSSEEQYRMDFDTVDPNNATTCTIISALDQLVLTQESPPPPGMVFVAGNLNLVVQADNVIIRGPLSFPGKTVSISARSIGTATNANRLFRTSRERPYI